MAKVTVNGEIFDFDQSRRPMLEALTIEGELKMRYADWETELQGGSVRALCGFIWMVWHRDGRDVPLADILSGKAEVNLAEVNIEADEGDADPTGPPPGPSPTTAASTPARSRKSSGSGRGSGSTSTRTRSRTSSTTSRRNGSSSAKPDRARIAELERETGTGDPDAERESYDRLIAEAEEAAAGN